MSVGGSAAAADPCSAAELVFQRIRGLRGGWIKAVEPARDGSMQLRFYKRVTHLSPAFGRQAFQPIVRRRNETIHPPGNASLARRGPERGCPDAPFGITCR